MITVEVARAWKGMAPLKNEWNELCDAMAWGEASMKWEWLCAWGRSGVRRGEPLVIEVRDCGRLTAAACLLKANRTVLGIGARTIEFAGAPHADYSDFLYRDERSLAVLWDEVRRQAEGVDLIQLQQLKESSPTLEFFEGVEEAAPKAYTVNLLARVPGRVDAPYKEYVRSGKLRERTMRRIEREGEVRLREACGVEEMELGLSEMMEQHRRRWAGTRTPSFFHDPAVCEMYRGWGRDAGCGAVLWILELNGRAVATLFGFVHAGRLAVHTLTFDVKERRLHCGLYCIYRVMRAARARGIEVMDFTRGSEEFKFHFADSATRNYEVVCALSAKGRRLRGWQEQARSLAERFGPAREVARAMGYRIDGATLPEGLREREEELLTVGRE